MASATPSVASAASATPATSTGAVLAAAFDAARLESDIRFIAKPRPPGSPHHRAVREKCAERLSQAGFTVSRQEFASGENVIGVKPGNDTRRIIVSAHYDHIRYCSGADDNATGVAIVWEAARLLGRGAFQHTLVVACWDDEEAGLKGSAAYAVRAREQGDDIALALALDGVGFTNDAVESQRTPPGFERLFPVMGKQLKALEYRGNFIAAIADEAAAPGLQMLQSHAARLTLPVLGDALGVIQRLALLDAARSDHASFWLQGFPAILITDTANFRSPYYHCDHGDDAVETLNLKFTAQVGQTVVAAVADLLAGHTP